MTDDQFLDCLKDAERCMDRTRSHRDALNQLDRATRGRVDDRDQRRALDEVLRELSRGSARKLVETIDAPQTYLQQESRSSLHQHEKMIRFAENYGADSATIHRIKQEHTAAMMATMTAGPFANIAKQACTKLAAMLTETIPVNQQTIDNAQAALDKAIADKAKADADKAKSERLGYLAKLAQATSLLISAIQGGSATTHRSEFVTFRKELQPLALELGYRIVFVGDRSTAVLVQA